MVFEGRTTKLGSLDFSGEVVVVDQPILKIIYGANKTGWSKRTNLDQMSDTYGG